MKSLHLRQLSVILTVLVFNVIACNSPSDTSAGQNNENAGQTNLLAANAINRAIETGDVSNLGDYIASEAIDHSGDHGDVKGLDNIKAGLAPIHKMAANDLKLMVIKELADSEYVFQWLRATGTATTTEMGAPVGSKFELPIVNITRFQNRKAIEHWEFMQPADMMKMMASQKGK